MDPHQAQHILEERRNSFIDEEPIRMLDVSTILEEVTSTSPLPNGPLHNVSIGRVSTYIYRTEVSKADGNMRIVFPTFASHWAVIVYDFKANGEDGFAYHLTFHDPVAAHLSPPANTSRHVKFTATILETMPEGLKEIGKTRFDHSDRMKIGRAMIKAFGSYHRVFWNCQHFARLYLSVITDGIGAFDEWTLSQTSNLFLCAFIITTPVVATNMKAETRKARDILAQFPIEPSSTDERLVLEASDEAITLAQSLAIEDYARNQPNDVRMERRGTIRDMLNALKITVEKGYKWVAR
jgi:hypothetical protein